MHCNVHNLDYPSNESCPKCEKDCPECDGTGNALHKGQLPATKILGFRICPECGGTGKRKKK